MRNSNVQAFAPTTFPSDENVLAKPRLARGVAGRSQLGKVQGGQQGKAQGRQVLLPQAPLIQCSVAIIRAFG